VLKPFALIAALCLSCPALAAPAQGGDKSLLALQAMDRRVATIGHRLARANVDICSRTMPLSGLLVHSIDQFSDAAQPIAASTFGLAEEPALVVVVPGSAAARAGLQEGDRIVSIGGQTVPRAVRGKVGTYARIRQIEEHLLTRLEAGPVPIEYVRGGERRSAVLAPEMGCLSRVQIQSSPKLNARADGTYAQLTTGIVGFTRSDDELALVIAHEMAHNILSHKVRLKAQKVSRGLLQSFDGSAEKIKATEAEADYLALYLLARAGFDINAAPGFWQRYSPHGLTQMLSGGTHPGRASRTAAAQKTIQEIALKRQQAVPLIPTFAN
jgi:Zn-dependent protease with chaperone function